MGPEGYKGISEADWFRAYFESAARAGASGAMFWILTPDPKRGYGVTYTVPRDEKVLAEIARAARLFASLEDEDPPSHLRDTGRHLVPRQFAFARAEDDSAVRPIMKALNDGTLLYRFAPEQALRGRFEKIGGGAGYVWGAGVGFFEYLVPAREEWQRVGEIVVRAHIKPVPPHDARGRINATRATLFINGTNCGSRLIPVETPPYAVIQEWRVNSLLVRAGAMRGLALSTRFAVEVDADQPFGLDISNFPEGYDPRGASPIEVEVRK